MSLEQQIKKLRGNIIFERCYNKHKKRRQRDKTISLEKCRLDTIKEYLQILKTYEDNKPNMEEIEKVQDYYVMINGVSMLDSEWKRLVAEQQRCGDTKVFPSRHPDSYAYVILKSLFKDNGEKSNRDKSVSLWDE